MVEDVILRIEKEMSRGMQRVKNMTTDYPPKERFEYLELIDYDGKPCIGVGDSYYNYESYHMTTEDVLKLADAIYLRYGKGVEHGSQ